MYYLFLNLIDLIKGIGEESHKSPRTFDVFRTSISLSLTPGTSTNGSESHAMDRSQTDGLMYLVSSQSNLWCVG